MKRCSIRLAALMLVGGTILCSAREKKCPPEGAELKPVNLNSLEEYKPLFDNWKQLKCYGERFCDKVSCAEFTYGKVDKKLYFHGSAYNESSHKPIATTGYLTLKEPGVFQGNFECAEADGTFYFLLVKKNFFILAGCLKNNEFSFWVAGKKEKLEANEEKELEEILTKNKLKIESKQTLNKDCGKKKVGL